MEDTKRAGCEAGSLDYVMLLSADYGKPTSGYAKRASVTFFTA